MGAGLFAALEVCLRKNLSFAAFRWKEQVHLWVQKNAIEERLNIETLERSTDRFLIAPFDLTSGGPLALRPDLRLSEPFRPDVLNELENCIGSTSLGGPVLTGWSEAGHAAAVEAAKREFASGKLTKVVLSRTIPMDCPKNVLPVLFQQALSDRPDAFVCLANTAAFGTWLGASPERLLVADGDRATVDSLAGTLPVASAPSSAEQWGEKEKEEQEIVNRSILETFRSCAVRNIRMHGPEVQPAGQVAHLRTTVTGQVGPSSLARLTFALHPTPAVCGSPKDEAARFIATHEPQDRSLYAGYWGPWRVDGHTALHVNIRCFRSVQDSAVLHVGGGITADSDARKEWSETEQKALTWSVPILANGARIS